MLLLFSQFLRGRFSKSFLYYFQCKNSTQPLPLHPNSGGHYLTNTIWRWVITCFSFSGQLVVEKKKLRILLHIFLGKNLTHHCGLTLAPSSSRSEKNKMDDLGATVSYMLKSCNLKRTKTMPALDRPTIFPHKFWRKKIIIKFFRQSTTNVTLLAQTFDLLNIRPRKMNFVELCAEQALPFLHVNKKNCTMHFNLRGWWWCFKKCQWWYIWSKMSKTFFLESNMSTECVKKKD